MWLLVRHTYDEFTVMHVPSGRLLDAYDDDLEGHDYRVFTTQPTLRGMNGHIGSQVWKFRKIGSIPVLDGVYRIRNKATGDYLEKTGSDPAVVIAPKLDVPEQLWQVRPMEGDIYALTSGGAARLPSTVLNSDGLALDSAGGLSLWQGAPTQMWYGMWSKDYEFLFRLHNGMTYLDQGSALTTRMRAPPVSLKLTFKFELLDLPKLVANDTLSVKVTNAIKETVVAEVNSSLSTDDVEVSIVADAPVEVTVHPSANVSDDTVLAALQRSVTLRQAVDAAVLAAGDVSTSASADDALDFPAAPNEVSFVLAFPGANLAPLAADGRLADGFQEAIRQVVAIEACNDVLPSYVEAVPSADASVQVRITFPDGVSAGAAQATLRASSAALASSIADQVLAAPGVADATAGEVSIEDISAPVQQVVVAFSMASGVSISER
jgi:hypothetical protein